MIALSIGACHVGSAVLGEWFWWLYTAVSITKKILRLNSFNFCDQIPLYASYKAWTSFIQPMFFGRSQSNEEEKPAPVESKRQQKLRQRQERGDPRVKAVPRR